MSNVYLLGGFQTDFARNWSREKKHIAAMIRETYEGSLVDTCIKASDIQAAFVGNFAAELYCMQGHLGAFFVDLDPAFKGLPTCRYEAACASSSVAALSAIAHIQAGMYDCIAVLGVEMMKTVDAAKGGDFLGTAAWYEKESKGVEFPFPKLFGKLGDEYDKRYGLKGEHLARIAEVNYGNAKRNNNAQTRDWYMSFDHACASGQYNPAISGRIKVTDCSQVTDGAAIIYLANEKVAADYARRCGVSLDKIPRILGWGNTTAPVEFAVKMQDSQNAPFVLPWTQKAIADAMRRAKLNSCWQLSAIETHDCFTTSEYMAIDHFGLTEPGKSWQAVEQGVINIGGKLPINPSGGLIGCGHPVGATGVRQMLDAYKQCTGAAGDYQVENAKRVATLNIGGSATTNVVFVIGFEYDIAG